LRIESGRFGPVEVPFDALQRVQTGRSLRARWPQASPIACLGIWGINMLIDV
jgi:hypothetical protein